VNELRQSQIDRGVPPAGSYAVTMYLIAGLLVVGFVCNWLVRPANHPAPRLEGKKAEGGRVSEGLTPPAASLTLAFRWAWVGVPLAWGVWHTVAKSLALFG
jgi:hypothetical protein